jgi:hypothetical protein
MDSRIKRTLQDYCLAFKLCIIHDDKVMSLILR